jgi:excisionase family DNA binding protein
MKTHLSANAFARLIDKDPKTVLSWIKKGLIPGVKRIGKIYRIPHQEVEKAKTSTNYP